METLAPTDKYKTFWRRFFAWWLDALVFEPLSLFSSVLVTQTIPQWVLVLWLVFTSFAYVIYSIVLHGLKGQTLGKMLFRIRVVDISEHPLQMRQAVLRDIFNLLFAFLNVIYFLLNLELYIKLHMVPETITIPTWYWVLTYSAGGLFIVEMLTMLTNAKRRSLHDWIAGSVVVKEIKSPSTAS